MSGFRGGSRVPVIRLRAWLRLHFSAGLGFEEWEVQSFQTGCGVTATASAPPTLTPSCFRLHESPHLEKIGRAFWASG
ncbi:hypothetical protein CgunFtcFv8_027286 [Champsocephalus gunnari]|uniref:Uncharacterized protein n=1 Tax=Champsocephalus gunnari TaxID=52237 RepID=A0AAN8E6F7_CHAGU|nr:hypothetical protein CgunFtcFv8_027286 [Champsocephalus gunnari]